MAASRQVSMLPLLVQANFRGPYEGGEWKSAHATFYGHNDGSGTIEAACGYGEPHKQSYGLQTAALSEAIFNSGFSCGQCYEIKCVNDDQWCKPGNPSLFITGTNLCPPNPSLPPPPHNGSWCNHPREHFDLSMPAFATIAEFKAGIIPIPYRRVPCKRQGGIKFTINGNQYFTLVLVWNVAGSGDVASVKIKGDKTGWTNMKKNWRQNWETDVDFTGQSLSFRVTTSDGRTSTSWHVVPRDWQYGQTFEGKNFNS